MVKYTKPYLWWEITAPYKHYVLFKSDKSPEYTFSLSLGQRLPFDTGKEHLSYTKHELKDYDFTFYSQVEPEVFKKYDYLLNNKPFLLVNQKLKNILLELCPDDVQFFKATIVPDNPQKMSFENHDYEVLNITKLVDVFDLELSSYTPHSQERIRNVKKIVFKENISPGIYLARQYNYPVSIIVSPELVKRFKREKITGVKFLKDFEYKG